MVDTYVINLKHEKENYYNVKNKLKNKNFEKIYRFNGIYGKKIKNLDNYDHYLTSLFKNIGPFGAIGSALSHYTLLDSIYNSKKYKKDEYVLILEDDVTPNFDYKELLKVVEEAPNNCDILVLHSFQGLIKYKEKFNEDYIFKNSVSLSAPCCSYLIKVDSIPKFTKIKIWNYFDVMHFNCNIISSSNIYIYKKQFFSTDYTISHNLNSKKLLYKFLKILCTYFNFPDFIFFFLFKCVRIPIFNIELSTIDIVNLLVTIIILIIFFYSIIIIKIYNIIHKIIKILIK
tara:strand:+ start:89 stop:949 length:861 start_codon:yes stop_codon:yes gene_type:complete